MTMYLDEVSSLQPGMELDRFVISSFIGKGGLGEVYEAVEVETSETSALRVMPKASLETDDPEFREILLNSLTEIKDPHLLPVLDFGEEEAFFWIRTDFVPVHPAFRARTVHAYARRFQGRLPESMVCGVIAQTLKGLHCLHEAGINHGNLKPENLLFAPDGTIQVADAGHVLTVGHSWDDFHLPKEEQLMNATPFDPLPGFSRSLPSLLRTFEYFAPEREEGRTVGDPLCDIYAVGLIAYHLITGRTRPLMRKQPTEIIPEINPKWDSWIKQATAYERDQRFKTVAEMAKALPDPTGKADDLIEEGFISEQKVFYVPRPCSLTYAEAAAADAQSSAEKGSLKLAKPKSSAPNPGVASEPSRSKIDPGAVEAVADTIDILLAGSSPPPHAAPSLAPAIQPQPTAPHDIDVGDPRIGFYLKVGSLAALLVVTGFVLATFLQGGGSSSVDASTTQGATESTPVEPVVARPLIEGSVVLLTRRDNDRIVQIRTNDIPAKDLTLIVTEQFYRSLRIGQDVTVYQSDLDPSATRPF
ncbi:MAG: serine/threonine protein kinase [Puniceicoccaceae bacterium]